MTPFAYLSVLISIVLGLGLTELLSGVQRLVHQRDRIRFFLQFKFLFFLTISCYLIYL